MEKFLCRLAFVLVAFVFVTNSTVIYGANTTSMYQDDENWKEKVDPYILEIMDDEDIIPVWLWMKDIDQAEAERKVFEKTGLTMNNLSVIDESISEELAVDIASLSIANEEEKKQVKKEFQEYLSRTKEERKIESQKTDKYIKELRSVQKEMLDEKTKDIINNLEIPVKNIVVSDTHAPVYIVNIETDDIERIASDPNITAMYYYEEAEFVEETSLDDLSEVIAASTVSKVHEDIGLSGEGVNIGILDGGFVQSSIYIPFERIRFIPVQSSYSFSDHASFVARVAAGTDGVASNAYVYSSLRSRGLATAIPDYVDAGVNLINCSGRYLEQTGAYSPYEIYLDYMINTKKFTFVKSAGNSHGVITVPGLAYNGITVGGFFNQGTPEISDDEMYEWSNYINTVDGAEGCMKPELIADQSYDPSGSTGTSYAAPYVSGTIAMLYELRPSLKTQPDVVKAILMASCHRKVTPISGDSIETMSQGLTDSQGAGVVDPYMAVAIAGRGDYGVRYMNGITTESQIRIKQPAYNSSGMNVSIAWLVEPADENTIGSTIDLDLEVYAGVEKVGSSTCDVSSSEMAYITPSSNEDDYNFVIKRISDTGDVIRFAYAFSIDNARYQYSDELEGVHFIKNSFNGAYLTYSDTGEITQELYTGDKLQQWFIYDNKIFPVLDSNKGFATGDVISLSYKKVIVRSFGRSQLTFMPNTYESNFDGTYIIHNTGNNALVPFNNASSVGTLLSWYPMSTSNSSQKWYLDSVSYQKGDINLDGVLSNNDSIMLSDYLAGSLTFTNIQEYMADINGDDVIDSNDSELISQIITN